MPQYFRVTRGQHSRGSSANMFGGPDTYMAIVVVPDNVEFNEERTPLNKRLLESKGIRIYHCGEFYHDHTSNRSKLYRAAMDRGNNILAKLQQQEYVLKLKLEGREIIGDAIVYLEPGAGS